MNRLDVTAQPSGFGASITGVDLSRPLDATTRAGVLAAWHRHQVLAFPDQRLSLENLERFTSYVGPFGVGGDTLFADAYAAYETLPADVKIQIGRLLAIHSAIGPYSPEGFYANEGKSRTVVIRPSAEARRTQLHPVGRIHPATGRRALFVNRVYTIGLSGLPATEAKELLAFLCKHATRSAIVYRRLIHHRRAPLHGRVQRCGR